ncbi:MAG: hypothetical protein FWC67_00310 [Defluviitaleaceae bacterium]|nr:hypothetical protein [Defluviitaleaceae bacterium]
MNTNPVKNIMIGLLSGLLAVLVFLTVQSERQHTLTAAQESNILAILEQNDITMFTSIPRDFHPKQELRTQRHIHDIDVLAASFFGNAQIDTNHEEPNGNRILSSYDTGKTMEFFAQNNSIEFEIEGGLLLGDAAENFTKSAAAAEKLSHYFLQNVLGLDPNLHPLHTNNLTHQGDYVLTFYEVYRGYILSNNQIRIHVTAQGITTAVFSRVTNIGFIDHQSPIFSADEALLALLNHLRVQSGVEGPIGITDMQLVFALPAPSQTRAIPAYLFTVSITIDGRSHLFNYLIDARSNTYIPYHIRIT